MSRSSNSLRTSDVITTPIKLKYTSSYDCTAASEAGIKVYDGVNGSITITGSVPFTTLVYHSVKQLYYGTALSGSIFIPDLSGSYAATTSSYNNSLQSTAAFGTYDADIRNFPTASGAQIQVLSFPRSTYGDNISRGSVYIDSNGTILGDDGNGNLFDFSTAPYVNNQFFSPSYLNWYTTEGPPIYVGNVFYKQGIIVITNPDYIGIIPSNPTLTNDTVRFDNTFSPKTINVLANDNPGGGTFLPATVTLTGGDVSLFTNNLDGTITLNTTTNGVYTVTYTVQSELPGGCLVQSVNQGVVRVLVEEEVCDCATFKLTLKPGKSGVKATYKSCTKGQRDEITLYNTLIPELICACDNSVSAPSQISVQKLSMGCVPDCTLVGKITEL